MTNEEAIKGLRVLAKDFSGYKPNEKMFKMAISALEQQMPMKPVDDRFVSNPFIWYTYCPQCGCEINTGDMYCKQCGQAIDWMEWRVKNDV